jgi:hypothetical protein
LCPCSCAYKQRLEYWSAQNIPNHTIAEWREILASVLHEINKNLTVKKDTLSSTIRKRTSAPDNRESSRNIGLLGIVLISLFCLIVVSFDISAIKTIIAAFREFVANRHT